MSEFTSQDVLNSMHRHADKDGRVNMIEVQREYPLQKKRAKKRFEDMLTILVDKEEVTLAAGGAMLRRKRSSPVPTALDAVVFDLEALTFYAKRIAAKSADPIGETEAEFGESLPQLPDMYREFVTRGPYNASDFF